MFHKSKYPFCLLVIGTVRFRDFSLSWEENVGYVEMSANNCGKLRGNCGKLIFDDFDGQHTHYKGYILKMQDFLPKKRRFFVPKLWKNHFGFPKEIYGEKYVRKGKIGFSTGHFIHRSFLGDGLINWILKV